MYLEPLGHVVQTVPVARNELLLLLNHAHTAVDSAPGFPMIRARALDLIHRLLEDRRQVAVEDIDNVLVATCQLTGHHTATEFDPNADLRAADLPIWVRLRAELAAQPADTVPTVRDRIHSRRLAEGISRRAVAQACGVTGRAVVNWEHGDTHPNRAHATILADMLGGTVADYLTD